METNTGRSKRYLESKGWRCWTVEQMVTIPARNGEPAKQFKRDCWNFGDLLCMHPKEHRIMLCQTTSRSNQSARIEKVAGLREADMWLEAGGEIHVHGWAKTGARGKRKLWEVAVHVMGRDEVASDTPILDEAQRRYDAFVADPGNPEKWPKDNAPTYRSIVNPPSDQEMKRRIDKVNEIRGKAQIDTLFEPELLPMHGAEDDTDDNF